ncbi:tetratricopeptide repeat protein [candidate division GN15 bacterium]|nr:tetratricopeptide repeat protein [candidate division GN15 bacterium]
MSARKQHDTPDSFARLVASYVPATIVDWYDNNPDQQHHTVSRLEGTLICIDASGFTALTRQLSDKGRSGPEELTHILNGFFEAMVRVTSGYGGDVLKFAGDALWVFVKDSFDPGNFLYHVVAALDRANAAHSLTAEQPLTVHIGAERGHFDLTSLGDPTSRLEAEPVGDLVRTVYDACDAAGRNQLALGPTLTADHGLSPTLDDFALITADQPTNAPEPIASLTRKPSHAAHLDILRRYLPAEVTGRLATAHRGSLQSEHRQTTVLFARLDPGEDTSSALTNQLAERTRRIFKIIHDLRGTVARIDPFKGGHKLLVFFGAPVRREDDELRAVLCARRLTEMSDHTLHLSVGLAFGSLFAGDVGSTVRREYTVMGDGVNMAARLMAKAEPAAILASEPLMERLPDSVTSRRVLLKLKGLGDQIPCYQITGIVESSTTADDTQDIIGQDAYVRTLQEQWETARTGAFTVVRLTGKPGVGKTTLIRRFADSLSNDAVVSLTCRDAILYGDGWLARKIPRTLFERSPQGYVALREFAAALIDERWLPLLSDIFVEPVPENQWTRDLPAELRTEQVRQCYARLVNALITEPTLLAIDDLHRADPESRDLVFALASQQSNAPLMLLVTVRTTDHETAEQGDSLTTLTIEPPTEDDWRDYFSRYFENGTRERELQDRVIERSGGNPQWISRYLSHCVDRDWLQPNRVSDRWELTESAVAMTMPDGVGDLHLAAFDSLPERERDWLKAASAAGGPFAPDDITAVQGTTLPARNISGLVAHGVLTRYSDTGAYDFALDSMREAIYNCLPESVRRQYHATFGRRFETDLADQRPDRLAYHFFRGGIWPEAFRYSLDAARRALARHAVIAAARNFDRCRRLAASHSDDVPSPLLLEFYREFTAFLHLEGRLTDAYPVLRQWRRAGKRLASVEACLEAPLETARTLWKQSRYPRARVFVEQLFGFPDLKQVAALEAGAYTMMAEIERRLANFDRAAELCGRAIDVATHHNDIPRLSEAHNNLGLALWGLGRLEEAGASFRRSLELDRGDGSMTGRAETLNNLAIIHYALGEYNTAACLLEETLGIFRDVGDRRNESYSAGNLANISRIIGRLDHCRELLERADDIFLKSDDQHAHAYTVGNLGDLDLVYGRWESAEERFQQAAAFADQVGDKELAAECQVRFGDLLFFCNQANDARSRYEQAVTEAEAIQSLEFSLRAYIGLARLAIQERDKVKARELIDTILDRAGAEKVIIAENEARFLTGELARISDETGQAIAAYQQVLNYSRDNGMFELALKSAVRWFEVAETDRSEAKTAVQELISQFDRENDVTDTAELLSTSGYFTHFAAGLTAVMDSTSTRRPVSST